MKEQVHITSITDSSEQIEAQALSAAAVPMDRKASGHKAFWGACLVIILLQVLLWFVWDIHIWQKRKLKKTRVVKVLLKRASRKTRKMLRKKALLAGALPASAAKLPPRTFPKASKATKDKRKTSKTRKNRSARKVAMTRDRRRFRRPEPILRKVPKRPIVPKKTFRRKVEKPSPRRSRSRARRFPKGFSLLPNMRTLRRAQGKKGPPKRRYSKHIGVDKFGYRSMKQLWPKYHRSFYGRLAARDGMHDIFYTKVTQRLRKCWKPLMPALVKLYNKKNSMLQRQAKGMVEFKGHLQLTWTPSHTRPVWTWKLPKRSSAVFALDIPTHTKKCLNKIPYPTKIFRKYREVVSRWDFSFKVGVTRPGVVKQLEHRRDPDVAPDSVQSERMPLVDLTSLVTMWITRANFQVQLNMVYQEK